jgi:hypothetical protein
VGIFYQKANKKPQKLNKASQIEDFVKEKTYHTPPEYLRYDSRI